MTASVADENEEPGGARSRVHQSVRVQVASASVTVVEKNQPFKVDTQSKTSAKDESCLEAHIVIHDSETWLSVCLTSIFGCVLSQTLHLEPAAPLLAAAEPRV